LELREEEERKKAAAEAEAAAAALAGAGAGGAKKADPKKDAGKGGAKAGGKGAVIADDKNAPQTLTIEYEEIESLDDFIILERKYNFNGEKIAAAHKKGPPASAGVLSTGKGSSWGDMSKVKDRTQELISQYKIIRSKPYTVAILLKLNKEIEKAPEPVEEVAPTVPDPKAKGKK